MIKLNSVSVAEKQLEADLETLERVRSLAEKVTAKYGIEPAGSNGGEKIADAVIKIVELEEKINRERAEVCRQKIQISSFLNAFEDKTERLIMTLRYVNCKTWPEIADIMNYSERQIYRIHNNAIEKIKREAVVGE